MFNYEELQNRLKAHFKELTEAEVKILYRKLATKYHPDRGGDTRAMQILNEAYTEKMKSLNKEVNLEIEQILIDKINEIITLEGLNIEILGSWVWVTGYTLPHKEGLKKAGFIFAYKKKAWFFRAEKDKAFKGNSNKPLPEIREKYGSKIVKSIKTLKSN